MPTTPAERKALLFLGAVAVLGVGVRVVRGVRGDVPAVAGAQPMLERQLAKAERKSADDRRARDERKQAKGGGPPAASRRSRSPRSRKPAADPAEPAIVDVDRADSAALVTLPGVGPALARRIVEDRLARGAFGGLPGLDEVPGIGPALLRRIAPSVTFSGTPRPISRKGPAARTPRDRGVRRAGSP